MGLCQAFGQVLPRQVMQCDSSVLWHMSMDCINVRGLVDAVAPFELDPEYADGDITRVMECH